MVAAAPSALYVVKKAERENLRIFRSANKNNSASGGAVYSFLNPSGSSAAARRSIR